MHYLLKFQIVIFYTKMKKEARNPGLEKLQIQLL